MAQIVQTLRGNSWHLLLYKVMRFCFRAETSDTPTKCGYWLTVTICILISPILVSTASVLAALGLIAAAFLTLFWVGLLLYLGVLIKKDSLVLKFNFRGKRYPVAFLTVPFWVTVFFSHMAYYEPHMFPWFFGGFLILAALIGAVFAWDKWITPNCPRYEIS